MRITLRTSALPTFATFVALAALLTPAVACTAPTGTVQSSATANATTAEALSAEATKAGTTAHRPPHHPGPDFLIVGALHEPIGLSADQTKTVQGLLPPPPTGPRPADKARAAALAAQIRAGKIDATADAPTPDDRAAERTALASALNILHATLTAAQRKALVEAIEANDANHEHAGPPGPPGGPGPMAHLLQGLDVTSAQEQEIEKQLAAAHGGPPSDADREAMRAKHEAARAAMKSKLETFASDSFDGASFVMPPDGPPKPEGHGGFLTDIAIVTSVLDASQREKLAERIEAGPPGPPAPPAADGDGGAPCDGTR